MKSKVRSILQSHLVKLGKFNTAWEGVNNPVTTPYQSVWLNVSASMTGAISDRPHGEIIGFLQVTLFYPMGEGTKRIEDRAELIRDHFYGLSSTEENIQVVIHSPPVIGGVFLRDDKLALPITINYSAYEL
ncbi:MAG: phage tail terminator-like protein [[Pasteurella] mairii]|uniref:Phage protein n=1 Tax=[Pasteurella] mairii TaxID=757 RepID=A0A379B3U2_9PAST|nr:phage tail terminator-like protein [[Pasteurella] mairii]SUB33303.1 Uncharacterised protein [[Pasteurella] mairii]